MSKIIIASATDQSMAMHQQWNDTDRGNLKQKLYQQNFPHHKSQMEWRGIEPETPCCKGGDQLPQPYHDPRCGLPGSDT
jgi:hypothetical protein